MGGQPGVDGVDERTLQPLGRRSLLEGLELDQELVDDAGDALALTGAGAAGPADGVELLDESDSPTLAPGVLAQGLEVGADLAIGLAVEHGLEGGGGHEQERHPGFGGHRLGHVGLSGARWSLEQDRLAGRATHLLSERAVGEEEVEGLGDLLDQAFRPPHVVEADG